MLYRASNRGERMKKLLLIFAFLFFTIHSDPWGWHALIDLEECNPYKIKNRAMIKEYIIRLCTLIEMKRFGDPVIVHFGQEERVAGYSMFQLIETSNISGHFVNENNSAYIDIFSCKRYSLLVALKFTASFFEGTVKSVRFIRR